MTTLVAEDHLWIKLVKVLHRVGVAVHLVCQFFVLLLLFLTVFLLSFIVLEKNELVMQELEKTAWVEGPTGGVDEVVDSVPMKR